MAVYPRGAKGIFYVDFEFNGQRIKQSTGLTSKRAAEKIERQMRAELEARQKRLGTRPSMTLDDAINRYTVTVIKPKGNSEAQNRRDLAYLKRFSDHFGAGTFLENITQGAIAEYQAERMATLSPGATKREMTVLKALLNRAVSWGYLVAVPRFDTITVRDERVRWLTEDEEARLLEACPPWLADLVTFYLDTGARKSEATGLKWSEVALDRSPRPAVRFLETKTDLPRTVPLPKRSAEMLRQLWERGPQPSEPVFTVPDRAGRLVAIGDFKKSWETARTRAGLTDVNVHDLRHTYASRLVMKWVPLINVSKLLGHASIQMTMRYAHLAPDALDDAVAVLDD